MIDTARTGIPKLRNAWVFYADVFAFGNLLVQLGTDAAMHRLHHVQSELFGYFSRTRIQSFFLFSDTIIVWRFASKDRTADMRQMTEVAMSVQEIAATESLILRGAIAFGDLAATQNFLLGSAYIRAHHLESKVIRYPQVILFADDVVRGRVKNAETLEYRSVPTKDGGEASAIVLQPLPKTVIKGIAGEALANLAQLEGREQAAAYRATWTWLIDNEGGE